MAAHHINIFQQEYKASMKMIEDFFLGKSDAVKSALRMEIEKCIETENFEWAAKLRDIYRNIDQFTQKQTVVINDNVNGIVVKIVPVEHKRIYIILVFHEGKIIDVLRFSENIEDIELSQIINSLELEFGALAEFAYQHHNQSYIYYGKGMKIKKNTRKELDQHFDNFITSYIASSSRQKDSIANDLLKGLQMRYNLKFYPYRIECLDISHLSGGRASGGLSCMVSSIYEKRGYRRYKIKIAKGGDDYDSLKECIGRRFKKTATKPQSHKATHSEDVSDGNDVGVSGTENGEMFLPDLFIIDGGPKQLDVIVKLLAQGILNEEILDHIQFASLGKGVARTSKSKIYGEKEKLYLLRRVEDRLLDNSSKEILSYIIDDLDEQPATSNQLPEDPIDNDGNITRSLQHRSVASSPFVIEEYDLRYDEVDKLLVRIRDEAHRFANAYRKKQMGMEVTGKKAKG